MEYAKACDEKKRISNEVTVLKTRLDVAKHTKVQLQTKLRDDQKSHNEEKRKLQVRCRHWDFLNINHDCEL